MGVQIISGNTRSFAKGQQLNLKQRTAKSLHGGWVGANKTCQGQSNELPSENIIAQPWQSGSKSEMTARLRVAMK